MAAVCVSELKILDSKVCPCPVEDIATEVRPLMHEELYELINQGLSDVGILSDEDDGWESDSKNVPVLPPEDTSEIDSNKETTELAATPLGDQSNDEEDCAVAVPDTPRSNTVKRRVFSYMERHRLTQKKNIKWRKRRQYLPPAVNWAIKEVLLIAKIVSPGSTTELEKEQLEVFRLGAAAIVLRLAHRITGPNYQLKTARIDRFARPPLSSDLEMKKKGRGTSEELISEDGRILLAKWYDNKAVNMASNFQSI
ncbi:hypothetical protein ILUMI_20839 [Ignelater luminosus]|uniref:PiggyBac transposable element-derived protein domain-containing protein n=1 Tax=Ignelater luminosus TaxID=2038154 RepID=A0A8K0CK47_IGNLU|nr:hypothetical protein ILUMI_20839 [Ignelater luminosus]